MYKTKSKALEGNVLPKKNEVAISSEPVYKKQAPAPPKSKKKPLNPKA
jgi:hypothetical protein